MPSAATWTRHCAACSLIIDGLESLGGQTSSRTERPGRIWPQLPYPLAGPTAPLVIGRNSRGRCAEAPLSVASLRRKRR
jgi:hypothetical protein